MPTIHRLRLEVMPGRDLIRMPVSGQSMFLRWTSYTADDAVLASTGPSLTARRPDASTVTLDPLVDIVSAGAGVWTADVVLDQGGQWQIEAGVSGPVAARAAATVTCVASLGTGAAWPQWQAEPPVRLAGSTMTGPLILSGPPTVALQAATKAYVDASGGGDLSAPNLINGFINASIHPGVTYGATLAGDTAIRLATRAGMQDAITKSVDWNKVLEVPPGQFDMQGAGLVIPVSDGFTWIGTKNTEGVMWGNNVPICTIGQETNSYTRNLYMSGFRFNYQTDQADVPLVTNASSGSGTNTLSFAAVPGVLVGMGVTGLNVPTSPAITTVTGIAGGVVTLSQNLSGVVASGATITFNNILSSALRIGFLTQSTLREGYISGLYNGAGPTQRAYRQLHVASNAPTDNGFFSVTMENMVIAGAVHTIAEFNLFGTQNRLLNFYTKQGNLDLPGPTSGHMFRMKSVFSAQDGGVIAGWNTEWGAVNRGWSIENLRNVTFDGCHWEGVRLTGFEPAMISMASASVNFNGCNIVSLYCDSAQVTGGNPAVFQTWGENDVRVHNLAMNWETTLCNRPFTLFHQSNSSFASTRPIYTIKNATITDLTGQNIAQMSLSPGLPRSIYGMPRVIEGFSSGSKLSEVFGARFDLTANATIYGVHDRCMYIYPAALAADRVVTLARTLTASGPGALIPPRIGQRVTVRRNAAPAPTNTLTVLGHNGVVLATITAAAVTGATSSAGVELVFVWNGSVWVLEDGYTVALDFAAGIWAPARSPVVLATSGSMLPDQIYACMAELDDDGYLVDAMGLRIIAGQPGGQVKFAAYALGTSRSPAGMPLLAETIAYAAVTNSFDVIAPFVGGAIRPGRRFWFCSKWTATSTLPTAPFINETFSRIGATSPGEALSFTTTTAKGWLAGDAFANAFPSTFPGSPTIVVTATMPIGCVRFA